MTRAGCGAVIASPLQARRPWSRGAHAHFDARRPGHDADDDRRRALDASSGGADFPQPADRGRAERHPCNRLRFMAALPPPGTLEVGKRQLERQRGLDRFDPRFGDGLQQLHQRHHPCLS
jgi:hypothetical protein